MGAARHITPSMYATFMQTLEANGLTLSFEKQALLGYVLQHNAWPDTNAQAGYAKALRLFEDYKQHPEQFDTQGRLIKTQYLKPDTLQTIQQALANPASIQTLCGSWKINVARGLGFGPPIDMICDIGNNLAKQPPDKLENMKKIGLSIVQTGGLTQPHLQELFTELAALGFQVDESKLHEALTVIDRSGRSVFTFNELRQSIPASAIRTAQAPSAPAR